MTQYVAKQISETIPAQTSHCFQTSNSVMTFVVATLIRPEIQKMAQEELDAVTMRERLPTLEDRPKLPFVDAICKEVTRWSPIAPLGELPSATPSPTQTYDDPQVYPTQLQKTTCMKVTLSRRVGNLSEQIYSACWLIGIPGSIMVMNIWCDTFPIRLFFSS